MGLLSPWIYRCSQFSMGTERWRCFKHFQVSVSRRTGRVDSTCNLTQQTPAEPNWSDTKKRSVSVALGLPQLSVTVLHLEELIFGCQVHVEAEKVSLVVQRATCNLRVQTSMQYIIWFSFCKVWTHFMCDLKISSAAHLPRPSSFDHGDPQSIGEDLHGSTMKRGYNNQKFEKTIAYSWINQDQSILDLMKDIR